MTDTQAPEKKDVVPSAYRDRYKATGGTNGDFIAVELQKAAKDGLESLGSIKSENGIEAARWATFNPGMQRMNLANVLRGQFLKGETIKILGKEYNAKHLAEDFNGTITDDDKVLGRLAEKLELVNSDRTIAALRKLFFAPAKATGKTAEQRAAEKAAKDASKQNAKDLKAAKSVQAKAKAAATKANDALTKATVATDAAKAKAKEAADAVNSADGDDAKAKAQTASNKANEAVGKAEEKTEAAAKKSQDADNAVKAADAKVAELEKSAA